MNAAPIVGAVIFGAMIIVVAMIPYIPRAKPVGTTHTKGARPPFPPVYDGGHKKYTRRK